MANPITDIVSWAANAAGSPIASLLYDYLIRGPQYQQAYDWARQQNVRLADMGISALRGAQPRISEAYIGLGQQAAQGYGDVAQGFLSGAGTLEHDTAAGYGSLEKWLGGQIGNITGGYAAGAGQLGQAYDARTQALMRSWGQQAQGIQAGYGALQSQMLGELAGRGEQARADIGETFGKARAEALADLQLRGMGGSSMSGDVYSQVAREQSAEERRLAEQLTTERLNIMQSMGVGSLAAQERLAGTGAGLYAGASGEGLAARERAGETLAQLGTWGAQMGTQLGTQRLADMANLGTWRTGTLGNIGLSNIAMQAGIGQNSIGTDVALVKGMLDWLGNIQYPYPQWGGYGTYGR